MGSRHTDGAESDTSELANDAAPRRRQPTRPSLFRMTADAVLFGSVWVAILVLPVTTLFGVPATTRTVSASLSHAAIATLCALATLWYRGAYRRPALPRVDETAANVAAVGAAGASLAISAAFSNTPIGATELLLGVFLCFVGRGIVASTVRTIRLPRREPSRVLIIGSGPTAVEIAGLVEDHPESRLQLVGFIGSRNGVAVTPCLGSLDELEAVVDRHRIDVALLTSAEIEGHGLNELVARSQAMGIEVFLSPGISRMTMGRISTRSLSHEPLVAFRSNEIRFSHRIIKRGMDIAGAGLGLLVAAPFMALIAIAIKLEDGGPVIYRSRRWGRSAEEFGMLKFRSMCVNADDLVDDLRAQNQRTGPLFKISRDPRVTRVGQVLRNTSLDELPQLVNVLRGDMSLVGPRPATEEEEAAFAGEHRRRFNVRPGLSGLWQVEARSHPSFNAYRRLDLHYLENWSLWLDTLIVIATFFQVLVSILLAPLGKLGLTQNADDVGMGIDLTASTTAESSADELATQELVTSRSE